MSSIKISIRVRVLSFYISLLILETHNNENITGHRVTEPLNNSFPVSSDSPSSYFAKNTSLIRDRDRTIIEMGNQVHVVSCEREEEKERMRGTPFDHTPGFVFDRVERPIDISLGICVDRPGNFFSEQAIKLNYPRD